MWNFFFGKARTPKPDQQSAKGVSSGFVDNVESPFGNKEASRWDVLIRTQPRLDALIRTRGATERDEMAMTKILETVKKDFDLDKGKAAEIVSTRFRLRVGNTWLHDENKTKILHLPGYQLLGLLEQNSFSRNMHPAKGLWRRKTHESADGFVYYVDIHGTEEYLNRVWEQDRFEISSLLRDAVEAPQKPLVLLVNTNDSANDLNVDRLVNLLDLGNLRRPFRPVMYSNNDKGVLKEALAWLKNAACSDGDETTANMTGNETEEGSSVVTATDSTVMSVPNDSSGYYFLDYEPTLLGGNATLQRFQPIQQGTHCPFARGAKLWGGKHTSMRHQQLVGEMRSIEEAAMLNAGPLAEFVARSNNGERLDGFCLEVPKSTFPGLYTKSVGLVCLGTSVRSLLEKLAELDPSGENAFKMGPIDSSHWRFRFAGEDFFLTSFAPCYDKSSSRYSFGTNEAFLLFQPMISFGRHGLIKDTPASATKWENPTSLRDKARAAFKQNGCPYHIPEVLPYPVAEHIVKPLVDDGTACVRWWSAPQVVKHLSGSRTSPGRRRKVRRIEITDRSSSLEEVYFDALEQELPEL